MNFFIIYITIFGLFCFALGMIGGALVTAKSVYQQTLYKCIEIVKNTFGMETLNKLEQMLEATK